MNVSIIRATRRFVSEHRSRLTKFFGPVGEDAKMTATDVHELVRLINGARQEEGEEAIYGTQSLASLGDAWTHLGRALVPMI